VSRLVKVQKLSDEIIEVVSNSAPPSAGNGCLSESGVSFFDDTFWDLWLQKIYRNFASMKFQWLLLLYIPIIWGMFHINPDTKLPWISEVAGLAFLGGGFLTLATSRMIAKTKLKETDELNTDQ